MGKFKIRIYPENKVAKFFLKQIVYPILLVVLIFFVLSYVVLLKTDKVAELGETAVYVSDDYTFDRDSITAYVNYGIQRLRRKGIDTPLDVNLCFCETNREYVLRNFFIQTSCPAQSRAWLHLVTFSPLCDTSMGNRDTVLIADTVYSITYLDQEISHELVHIYQYEKLGLLSFLRKHFVQSWKIEGFADYVANSSVFYVPFGLRVFMKGENSDESLEPYFTNYFVGRLRTDYLLEYKHVPEDEYWETDYDVAKLDEEIRQALKSGDYQIFRQNDYE